MKLISTIFLRASKPGLILLLVTALITSCREMEKNKNANEKITMTTDSVQQMPAAPPAGFTHQTANVNGINIHYVIGGEGEPLVLVHGFGQNWFMWNRLLPELSKHFKIIAPDLRGGGESDKPEGGYDKKTMASDIHELVKKLGYNNINLVGHDIGLMVAYSYAAQFGSEVKKVALMDALVPGVEPVWHEVSAVAWHFGFFRQPYAAELVSGRERLFFTNFWPDKAFVKDAFTKEETDEFIRAYSTKDALKGSFHWYGNFSQDVKDNEEFTKHKLKMPLLAMGGDHSSASYLADHARRVAEDVHELIIKDAGHWLVQEQTEQVQKGLLDFFTNK